VNVGQLDRSVQIQTQTTAQDSYGQPVETWATLATVWAGKSDRVASEVTSAGQVVEVLRTVWTIRHRADVNTRHRLAYSSTGHSPEYFYITGTQEIGRRVGLKLTTERRT